jgi:hypothetical protein
MDVVDLALLVPVGRAGALAPSAGLGTSTFTSSVRRRLGILYFATDDGCIVPNQKQHWNRIRTDPHDPVLPNW